MNQKLIITAFIALSVSLFSYGQKKDAFSGFKIAEEGAWCWFADPRALHYENASGDINATFIGYIDIHGNIKATQIDWKRNTTETVLVRSWFQPDDHDNPSFLVLPDERVMIIYSRHTDEPCFYYRISTRKGDITSIGEEKVLKTANNTTYPNPFILSDDPNHIYMCWRGIGWHPTVARMTLPDKNDEIRFDWGPHQLCQSSGARPYAKYISNGKDKIYLAYTTGHPDNEYPNWLYCNVFDINSRQLSDIKGNVISTVGTFNVRRTEQYLNAYPYTVVDHPSIWRDWLWNMAFDDKGNPAIGMTRISEDKKSHTYHYARWDGEKWQVTYLAEAGGHFHQTPTTEKCYSAGMYVDRDNPHDVYCAVPVNGVYEIVKYTLNDDYSEVVKKEAITKNSSKNNSRPFCIEGTERGGLHLAWMNGDYYYWLVNTRYPNAFPTSLMAATPIPSTKKTKGMKTITKMVENIDNDVVIDLWKGMSYKISAADPYPVLTIDGKDYKSQNIFATADSWATDNNATTDSKWYTPRKLTNCTLTFTDDGRFVTVMRDGVIDMRVEKQ